MRRGTPPVGWTIDDHLAAARAGMTARQRIERTLDALDALDDPAVLIGSPLVDLALAQADELDAVDPTGVVLHGVPFVIKDNIDLAGVPTTAACPDYSYVPDRDARAVARLRAAGAIPVAKVNLDQFATGLVGTRSPYGTPRNPFDATVVPGGSSSGSAVAVARGLVPLSLGTDTAGSGRVPAAMCGIVGFKGTLGRVSTRGVVPAVRRADCTTVFAQTVHDAALAMGIIGVHDADDPWSRRPPGQAARPVGVVGVVSTWPEGLLDDHTRDLYERSCRRLAELGYVLAPIDLASFLAAGALLYDGPLVAERHVAVGDALSRVQGADPTVAKIILGATRWTAADAYAAEYRLTELRHACRSVFEQVDAIALPTAGCIATLADVAADPIGANARLGRLTTFANLLDLACVAVPMGMRTDGIPSGLQLIGAAWSDDVLAVAAASFVGEDAPSPTLPAPEDVPLVVVGAHLRGQPLNGQLTERGARFVRSTTTSAEYRLYAMAATTPAKPALVRSEVGGAPIAVEVWMMPLDQLGSFLAIVPPPLCLGTVELSDGSWQKGFLCEPRATDGAVEITEHGGWIAYRSTLG